jgi:hypothetical protein
MLGITLVFTVSLASGVMTAPLAKRVDIMFCAPTSKAMTKTMKIKVLKKPLRSPPKISTPPATTIPIIES